MVSATKKTAATRYGVKLKWKLLYTCACRSASTRPTDAIRAVSFCSDTKSLRSGGTTRRTACGSTTCRSVCPCERPSAEALATCDGCTPSMPARNTSAT
jgi:hypothetical protein